MLCCILCRFEYFETNSIVVINIIFPGECHSLYFILQSCRDILSLVFQIFHTIPTVPDAAFTDRIQACVKVLD